MGGKNDRDTSMERKEEGECSREKGRKRHQYGKKGKGGMQ